MICPLCNTDNLPGSEVCRNCLTDLTQFDLPVAQDRVERSLMEDPVSILRPRQAIILKPTATVSEAIQTMIACDVGAVLIADKGKLLGILSERDLLTRVAGTTNYSSRPVRGYMTPHPETVESEDSLAFALHKMDGGGYRHLPVLKNGQPTGVISVRDMLRHITRLCAR
jgi:CBS domain-containing protein